MTFAGQTLSCAGAIIEGVLHSATLVPTPYLEFIDGVYNGNIYNTTFNGCQMGGIALDVMVTCPLTIAAAPNPGQLVHLNLSDTNVTGLLSAQDGNGNACIRAKDTIGGIGCDMTIAGTTNADLNETRTTDGDGFDWQDLTISGNGLSIDTVFGVCAGLIQVNAPITTAASFDIRVIEPGVAHTQPPAGNGSINFRPDPNAED